MPVEPAPAAATTIAAAPQHRTSAQRIETLIPFLQLNNLARRREDPSGSENTTDFARGSSPVGLRAWTCVLGNGL